MTFNIKPETQRAKPIFTDEDSICDMTFGEESTTTRRDKNKKCGIQHTGSLSQRKENV